MPGQRTLLLGLLVLFVELPPAPAQHPGYCPRTGSASMASCGLSCHNDTACSPGEKCCTRAWGSLHQDTGATGQPHGSAPPHPSVGEPQVLWGHAGCTPSLPSPPAKPGLCPRKRAQRSAAACPNRCADDRDCPG
uniref:WAP domain-containing protein n=1 Tax=Strix occidentalis caurina TaxID=311401 RepID=A0A8D0G1Q4_STROC